MALIASQWCNISPPGRTPIASQNCLVVQIAAAIAHKSTRLDLKHHHVFVTDCSLSASRTVARGIAFHRPIS